MLPNQTSAANRYPLNVDTFPAKLGVHLVTQVSATYMQRLHFKSPILYWSQGCLLLQVLTESGTTIMCQASKVSDPIAQVMVFSLSSKMRIGFFFLILQLKKIRINSTTQKGN